MEIYERMFEKLDELNIKDSEFARKIGKNQSVIATWRTRGKNPPIELAFQICEILGISLEYFITGKEKNNLTKIETEMLTYFRALEPTEQARELGRLEAKVEEAYKLDRDQSLSSRTG